eukprot:5549207-Amphidinium_carterae.3
MKYENVTGHVTGHVSGHVSGHAKPKNCSETLWKLRSSRASEFLGGVVTAEVSSREEVSRDI